MIDERPENPAEAGLSRALGRWVGGVRRRARAVRIGFAVTTAALLVYTAFSLGINASHTALLSEDLGFWRQYKAFAEVFPIVDETLFVVVDAESSLRARKATDALAAALSKGDLFTSVYVPGGGPYFETHALLYLSVAELEDITDNLASVQPWLAELSTNRSLTTLVEVLEQGVDHAQGDPVLTENLHAVFDSVSLAAQAVLEERPRPISWAELLLHRTLPGDSSRRLILLDTHFDYHSLLPADRAISSIHATAAELGLVPERGVRVRVTGNPALNYDEMILVARSAVMAIVGSLIAVGAILWMALGSVRLLAATLVTLLVGLVWTAAFAAFAVGHLNVISVAFAVLFIGLGVDFGIHMCMRFAELMREGEAPGPALDETARSVGSSLALCALTTTIGFFVFIPTDYRAIGELGLIAGTGMPISLFCSLTLLPALLTHASPARDGASRGAPDWFTRALVPLSFDHAKPVVWVAGALALGGLAVLPRARFDHNVARMRDPSAESAQAFEDLLTDSDTSPWTMDAIAPSLEAAERIGDELESLDVVERTVTLADYVPADQDEKLDILADLAFIVPEPGPVAQQPPPSVAEQISALRSLRDIVHRLGPAESARRAELQLDRFLARLESLENKGTAVDQFEESLLGELPDQVQRLWNALDPGHVTLENLPENLTRRMLAPDGRARIEILPSEDLGETAAIERFVDGVKRIAPGATGSAVTVLEWARATVRSFQQALTAAIAVVAAVVWLLWRRLSDLVLVLAPLLLASLLTGAIAAAAGIAFNFVNVVVLPLLLGIGVDSGIHLVHRYRVLAGGHQRIGGDDLLGTSTAHAVFFSALTTMASFGTLALSGHGGISSMGQLLLIGVVLMLACNLILLPALISLRLRSRSATPSQPPGR